MTARDIIDRADQLEPNQYDTEQKLRWLSSLDGQIYEEIIRTHEGNTRESFGPYQTEDEELLVGAPYGEELYVWYLQAQVALQNADPVRYEQAQGAFQGLMSQFSAWYNREHMPIARGSRFRF